MKAALILVCCGGVRIGFTTQEFINAKFVSVGDDIDICSDVPNGNIVNKGGDIARAIRQHMKTPSPQRQQGMMRDMVQ
jgi:hypothetical protein